MIATIWRIAVSRVLLSEAQQQRTQPTIEPASSGIFSLDQIDWKDTLKQWCLQARSKSRSLMKLLVEVQNRKIPLPIGTADSQLEYDRKRRVQNALAMEVLRTYSCFERASLDILVALPAELFRSGFT